MKPEDKIVSLELAKRMKELGWDYKVERYWNIYHTGRKTTDLTLTRHPRNSDSVPAPDAIEIGEAMKGHATPYYSRGEKEWISNCDSRLHSKTEAEARGKMWCYLKEKELLP